QDGPAHLTERTLERGLPGPAGAPLRPTSGTAPRTERTHLATRPARAAHVTPEIHQRLVPLRRVVVVEPPRRHGVHVTVGRALHPAEHAPNVRLHHGHGPAVPAGRHCR